MQTEQFNGLITEKIGIFNPITLPIVDISELDLRERIVQENCLFFKNNEQSSKVYKAIPCHDFKDGNEIRIAKIASEIGVAPKFHQAFLVKNQNEKFVFIEMDESGKSLGQWKKELSHRQIEQVISHLYEIPENFYFELFSKIKLLAEKNIAYKDCHIDNLIISYETKGELQLNGFRDAKLLPNQKSAKAEAMKSVYNQLFLSVFNRFRTLSEKSEDLIQWFLE